MPPKSLACTKCTICSFDQSRSVPSQRLTSSTMLWKNIGLLESRSLDHCIEAPTASAKPSRSFGSVCFDLRAPEAEKSECMLR